MFIIPCKYSKEHSYIYRCVDAINDYHPGEEICVIDSCSEDMSYASYLQEMMRDCYVIGANKNFGTNAYAQAFRMFPDEDFYYCIYDSLILQNSLEDFEQYPITAFRYFNTPPTGWGQDANGLELSVWAEKQCGRPMPVEFRGLMGPMFMAQNSVMRDITRTGLFNILPEDKYQLCAMERIYGIVLGWLGYDFWTHAPQGEMHGFFDNYPEDRVKKINAARM